MVSSTLSVAASIITSNKYTITTEQVVVIVATSLVTIATVAVAMVTSDDENDHNLFSNVWTFV